MIPLSKPYFDFDELQNVKEVLDSGWVSQGPKTKEFEDKVSEYLGIKYAICVSNCTAALHLALLSLGIGEGDEVLVADYTFPATGHAVLFASAKPVFVDIDLFTYNLDCTKVLDKITPKTKAIIPVHTFGQPVNMFPIMLVAKKYNLKVIEDAACALGAKYYDQFVGTIGDVGCFSFHARKGITTGEGGMVVTNNKNIAEEVKKLSVFGMISAWDRERSNDLIIPKFVDLGYNYKMSDIAAAVGVAQMSKIDRIIEKKIDLAEYWNYKLKDISGISTCFIAPNIRHVYQSYVVIVNKRIDRNKLILKLRGVGIQTQIGTYASHIQPIYESSDRCPNSLDIFNRAIALPMYYELTKSDIDIIISEIKKILGDML